MSGRCRSSSTRSGWCSRASSTPEPALHAPGSAVSPGAGQDALDEAQVGQVVLDVEHRGRAAARRPRAAAGRRARRVTARRAPRRPRQLDPERRCPRRAGCSTTRACRPSPRRAAATARARARCPRSRLRSAPSRVERREELRRCRRRRCPGRCRLTREPHPLVARPGRTRPSTRPAGPVVLDRVRQQVEQHLLEPLPVGQHVAVAARRPPLDEHACRARRPAAARGSTRLASTRPTRTGSSDSRRRAGLDARDVEHLVDQGRAGGARP